MVRQSIRKTYSASWFPDSSLSNEILFCSLFGLGIFLAMGRVVRVTLGGSGRAQCME